MKRRSFLRGTIAATGAVVVAPSAIAKWSKETFEVDAVDALLTALGADKAEDSDKIKIKAPEIAENGAVVPITVTSEVEGTTNIYLITKEGTAPLTAAFTFGELAIPSVKSRIKMGKSSDVIAIVKADDKFYKASVPVKVTKGGCGG